MTETLYAKFFVVSLTIGIVSALIGIAFNAEMFALIFFYIYVMLMISIIIFVAVKIYNMIDEE